jgi:hypothetical protein
MNSERNLNRENKMTQTIINNRTYIIEDMGTKTNASADMIKRGWDGHFYLLTGKRGAAKMAYRNATTGAFEIVCSV